MSRIVISKRIKLILRENEYPTKILNTVICKYLEKKITYLTNYNLKGKQVYLSLNMKLRAWTDD